VVRVQVDSDDDRVVLITDDEVIVSMDSRVAYRIAEAISDAAYEVSHRATR
jgi:hypothetical protein